MTSGRGEGRTGRNVPVAAIAALIAVTGTAGSCHKQDPGIGQQIAGVLRVGVSQWSAAPNPSQGLRQLNQLLSLENLARTGEDGRMQPWLAETWARGDDGRSLTIKLRRGVKFHDGAQLDASAVVDVLQRYLKGTWGQLRDDVEYVAAPQSDTVRIVFRQSSPFLDELLEASVQKAGGISTGPFATVGDAMTEMKANQDYYLGPPATAAVHVESFPSVRTAWAELLRNRIDMLWEVGPDALPSIEKSTSISVFTFTRRYQYVLVLNTTRAALRSPSVRRALNLGVNRDEVVRNALNSYGVASSGPVWPHNWAFHRGVAQFGFDPAAAAALLGRNGVRFSCLIPPDAPFERLALELKRQLATIGVEMNPEEVSYDELAKRAAVRDYQALLIEVISGPTLVRPYLIWHSNAPLNWGQFGDVAVDAALDGLRHSGSDDAVRTAVARLQQAFIDDPPAVFLAWSVRARAFSKRFDIPAEEGRDVLSTLRFWKPTMAARQASRN
jgi:peptide/nickel transport system substrate-binding protein